MHSFEARTSKGRSKKNDSFVLTLGKRLPSLVAFGKVFKKIVKVFHWLPKWYFPLEFSSWQPMKCLTDLFENFFVCNQSLGPHSRGHKPCREPLVASIAAILWPLEHLRFFQCIKQIFWVGPTQKISCHSFSWHTNAHARFSRT